MDLALRDLSLPDRFLCYFSQDLRYFILVGWLTSSSVVFNYTVSLDTVPQSQQQEYLHGN